MTYTYLIGNKNKSLFKIGHTKDLNARLIGIQVGCPYKVEIIYAYPSMYATKIEGVMHRHFASSKEDQDGEGLVGEWFCLGPLEIESFMGECKKIDDNIKILKENSTLDIDKLF